MTERVGFIGLGIMGMGMARNLRKAGFELQVWNRTGGRRGDGWRNPSRGRCQQ